MKIIKSIFGRIWALWGLTTFVATFLIIIIPSLLTALIPDPKGMSYFIQLAKVWMNTWLFLIGCPVTVRGKFHFKKGQPYIVTCNHNSLLDIPLSSPYIPGPNQTIAKKEFTKIPIFGWYYERGSVIVDRKSDASRRKSYELMKAALEKGFHMCIYPEGTRNRTQEPLKRFYDGAFKLAAESGYPIIPAVILNTKKALPANRFFYLMPHKLGLHFLQPIEVGNRSAEELKEETFNTMAAYYVKHQD
ncbi:lysophospholipid acyltransferase family protein [Sediminibacterium sp. TEGAF015]|uniref:lysophospholipid acyltransferase family protein n=1 Tax=Sediminibacterium sp. TEGAF015 TaxID=575378 RepID=UPI0021FDD18B|nr:1-acyl-sn-glycerol-3-phosphate acyltransferase [Sediminibacterium sp. TEGAF015]BDQ11370.1 1-acyl-sn-glycerol-3-phosphate acyltransferase [Sediminibacterium sp. TEGAF015]